MDQQPRKPSALPVGWRTRLALRDARETIARARSLRRTAQETRAALRAKMVLPPEEPEPLPGGRDDDRSDPTPSGRSK